MAREIYDKSILTNDLKHCYICGAKAIQYHHVFGDHNKVHAEEDGLWIPVCLKCHVKIHNEKSQKTDYGLKRTSQWEYERTHTREEFRKRYGKSYL